MWKDKFLSKWLLHKKNVSWELTSRGANPRLTQYTIVEVPVSKHIGQAIVVVILKRVQVQEFLHADVVEAEGVGGILLISSPVDLCVMKGIRAVQISTQRKSSLLEVHEPLSTNLLQWCNNCFDFSLTYMCTGGMKASAFVASVNEYQVFWFFFYKAMGGF